VGLAQAIPLADNWGMHGDFGWWMPLMMIPMLLFWGAIVFGVVWLIRSSTSGRPTKPIDRASPIEILERRFAEGAITVEDYQARREVLVSGGSAHSATSPEASR
jgi:putative membrane protein